MKIRNGFVSNSSSSSFTVVTVKMDSKCYCPICYSNKEIKQHEDYYECIECKNRFYDPLTIKDVRQLKLDKLALC